MILCYVSVSVVKPACNAFTFVCILSAGRSVSCRSLIVA